MEIWDFLREGVRQGASDVHLTVGAPPMLRVEGELRPIRGSEPLRAEETAQLVEALLDKERSSGWKGGGESDFSCQSPEGIRFRVQAFQRMGHLALAIRVIPSRVPTPEQLGLSASLTSLMERRQGLFLVTGPTGSGKSTTLACLLQQINEQYARRIITLEDPIEYVYEHRRSLIDQREVGRDTASFSSGLRSALRQDPDVILLGEMRDQETIATAITAAETGHLVLSTLHTSDAPQTVDRMLDAFPAQGQRQIRAQLASALLGVVSQRLLPRADGGGRVAVQEILINTQAVANLIRTEKAHQLRTAMQTGRSIGMQTFRMHLVELLRTGVIDEQAFESQVKMIGNKE